MPNEKQRWAHGCWGLRMGNTEWRKSEDEERIKEAKTDVMSYVRQDEKYFNQL